MFSVVIPCYITNSEQYRMTDKCIELARKKTKLDFELIIVETCSDYFMEEADVYIQEKKRTSATESISRGLRACNGDYVALLTNDVFVDNNWLESLYDCFRIKDCGASTLATDQFNQVQDDKIEEGLWASVFMMPSKLLKEVDYFDLNYKNSWDDTDLWMKLYTRGYKVYRNFNCVVKHLVGKTHYSDKEHNNNYEKNREFFINKWKEYKDTRIYKILFKGIFL